MAKTSLWGVCPKNMLSSSKKFLSFVATGVFALLPLLALGQVNTFKSGQNYINDVINTISGGVNAFIPIMIGLTFIYFAYCMIKYIQAAGDDKEKSRGALIWSVIAIVLVVSIWGVANLLQNLTGATADSDTVKALDIDKL